MALMYIQRFLLNSVLKVIRVEFLSFDIAFEAFYVKLNQLLWLLRWFPEHIHQPVHYVKDKESDGKQHTGNAVRISGFLSVCRHQRPHPVLGLLDHVSE